MCFLFGNVLLGKKEIHSWASIIDDSNLDSYGKEECKSNNLHL